MMMRSGRRLSLETYACASKATKMRTQRAAEKTNMAMSHAKEAFQYVSGFTPDTNCRCFTCKERMICCLMNSRSPVDATET